MVKKNKTQKLAIHILSFPDFTKIKKKKEKEKRKHYKVINGLFLELLNTKIKWGRVGYA